MFDINLGELKEAILQQSIREHQQAINLCLQQIVDDDSLIEDEKQLRIKSIQNISNAVLALNVTVKLIEENNKVIWNKLIEMGVIKE